jgi:hypothetical protein
VTAVFTLAGVIVGGLLTGAVQAFLQRRQERRALLVASRLILDELLWVQGVITEALTGGGSDVRAILSGKSLDALWKEHRPVLAAELDQIKWTDVSVAVEGTRLRVSASEAPEEGGLRVWKQQVETAISNLRGIIPAPRRVRSARNRP